jgi:DNA-binding transcriptional ArsR family regulator
MTNSKTLRRNNDPFTSHESASKVDSTSMENIVCEVIDSFGEAGCISDQVQYALAQYRYSSVTARYKALKDKGLVIVDGRTVKAESGRKQLIMWSARYYYHKSVTDEDIIQHQAEERAGV